MHWKKTFLVVTACALCGMVMGGLFGYFSGKITPDLFRRIIPWHDVEPVGAATFLGSTIGVLLGGGLGCFSVLLQFGLEMRKGGRSS